MVRVVRPPSFTKDEKAFTTNAKLPNSFTKIAVPLVPKRNNGAMAFDRPLGKNKIVIQSVMA